MEWNGVLARISGQLIAVRLECRCPFGFLSEAVRTHNPILLRELHWLRVPERVTFRLCVLAYRCLHGTALTYLAAGAISRHLTSILDVMCVLLTQPCWWYRLPDVQHSVTVLSQWLYIYRRHVRGTACRRLLGMHCR